MSKLLTLLVDSEWQPPFCYNVTQYRRLAVLRETYGSGPIRARAEFRRPIAVRERWMGRGLLGVNCQNYFKGFSLLFLLYHNKRLLRRPWAALWRTWGALLLHGGKNLHNIHMEARVESFIAIIINHLSSSIKHHIFSAHFSWICVAESNGSEAACAHELFLPHTVQISGCIQGVKHTNTHQRHGDSSTWCCWLMAADATLLLHKDSISSARIHTLSCGVSPVMDQSCFICSLKW